jgi:four helix bundle protein
MRSEPEKLRGRTQQFAIRIVKVLRSLPKTDEAPVLGRQVLHSGTALAASSHGLSPPSSKADFTSRRGGGVEEADETVFWLELLLRLVSLIEQQSATY